MKYLPVPSTYCNLIVIYILGECFSFSQLLFRNAEAYALRSANFIRMLTRMRSKLVVIFKNFKYRIPTKFALGFVGTEIFLRKI
jgi:hypothetical protein